MKHAKAERVVSRLGGFTLGVWAMMAAFPVAALAQTGAVPVGVAGAGGAAPIMVGPGGELSSIPSPLMAQGAGGGNTVKSPGVPDSIDTVIKSLSSSTNDLSLDDLARAQDAIQRLNMLLEIERKLGDIDKARADRSKVGMGGGAISAAAIGLPPRPPSMPAPVPSAPRSSDFDSEDMPPPAPRASNYKIERIVGADGRYAAVVNVGGKSVTVRVGDRLPDGSEVSAIGATSLQSKGRGGERTLRMDSVGRVSGSP